MFRSSDCAETFKKRETITVTRSPWAGNFPSQHHGPSHQSAGALLSAGRGEICLSIAQMRILPPTAPRFRGPNTSTIYTVAPTARVRVQNEQPGTLMAASYEHPRPVAVCRRSICRKIRTVTVFDRCKKVPSKSRAILVPSDFSELSTRPPPMPSDLARRKQPHRRSCT